MKLDYSTLSHTDILGALENEFNGILGFAGLLQTEPEFLAERTEGIIEATERALSISRVLGARVERMTQARFCLLNEEIYGCEPMLSRVAGRGIEITLRLDPRVEMVPFGRREVEALLMQLVVGARDACGGKGSILIRTLAISSAEGMPRMRLIIEDDGVDFDSENPRWALSEGAGNEGCGPLPFLAEALRDVGATATLNTHDGSETTVVIDFPCATGVRLVRREGKMASASRVAC